MKQGDRVQETSTTTGTGSLTLAGATAGHRTFLVEVGEVDETTYLIQASDGAWEISRGTLTGTTLTRTLVKSSTGSLLDLPAGTHYVTQILDAATVNEFGAVAAPLTLASGTITASEPALNITQTWNDAGVAFEGMTVNVTDTASAAGSELLDLQTGGVSRLAVSKIGTVVSGVTGTTNTIFNWSSGSNATVFHANAFFVVRTPGSWGIGLETHNNRIVIYQGGHLAFAPGNSAPDAFIRRDAANILSQYSSTNAQTLRIHNTHTDASNYERFAIRWNTNTLELITEAAGTGTLRDMSIAPSGGKLAFLGATPVARQAHVADADTAHALNATFSDTEVEAALNALGTKLNSVLAALRSFGLLATS